MTMATLNDLQIDTFNSEVRRVANRLANAEELDCEDRLIVAAAHLYLRWEANGEFDEVPASVG